MDSFRAAKHHRMAAGVPASTKDRSISMITRAMGMMGVIGIVLASSGCTMEWVRMDAAARPFGPAHSSCRAQADDHWPVRNEVATRTVYEDRKVPCRLDEVCAIDGKYNMVPMPKEESYIVDVNASDRSSEFNACMAGAGWQQQLIWFNRR
ncbi:MAG: hypothetical protein RR831_03955 [Stenotrophomonas sp.]|uniref:hypothetical protein n=1 Tax=Stenotrophomonas sp. NA06056 TaxID=2742129 RepID=UPI0020CA9E87|nr:hypothetical protein [Stenotrophomonas sp. NA06056]